MTTIALNICFLGVFFHHLHAHKMKMLIVKKMEERLLENLVLRICPPTILVNF